MKIEVRPGFCYGVREDGAVVWLGPFPFKGIHGFEALLRECEDVFAACQAMAHAGETDAVKRAMVQALGEFMGYGNLMITASDIWREKAIAGSEFVAGPCRLTVDKMLEAIRGSLT